MENTGALECETLRFGHKYQHLPYLRGASPLWAFIHLSGEESINFTGQHIVSISSPIFSVHVKARQLKMPKP